MNEDALNTLIKKVIGCAYGVHNTLGPGFLEKVYENSLMNELTAAGLQCVQQEPVPVFYRGQVVGEFFADIVVEGVLILELKAIRNLSSEHEVQLVNYLSATGRDHGLLVNFGDSVDVKRKFRVYKKSH